MIKKLTFYLLLWGFCFCLSTKSFCQEINSEYSKHKMGFSFGYGDQEVNLIGLGVDLQVDYSYKIIFTQINYIYSFFNNNLWDVGFNLQSEYGITSYKYNNSNLTNSKSYEFGISGGFILTYKVLKEKLNLYILISSGPHYAERSPERQVSGFMFNNNFDIGMYFLIKKNLNLDFRTGLRHLSNANLQTPNAGINNWIVTIGFLYQLENESASKSY